MIGPRIKTLIVCLLLVISSTPYVFAVNESDSVSICNQQILEDHELVVQDKCSGHSFFFHVKVRDDGWFVVFYRSANQNKAEDEYLSRVYIDLFNADGEFQKELSFVSYDDVVLDFTDSTIDIYFWDYMLSYELSTDTFRKCSIPDNYAKESGLYSEFIQKTIEADGWKYECGRNVLGYTSIRKTKGNVEKELLSLSGHVPGVSVSFTDIMPYVVVSVLSIAVVITIMFRRIRKRK